MKSEKSALGVSPEVLLAYMQQNSELLASVIRTDIEEHSVKAADNRPLLPDERVLVLYDSVCAVYEMDGDKVTGVRFSTVTEFIPDKALGSLSAADVPDVSRWRDWLIEALRYRKLRREHSDRPGQWWFRWPHRNLLVCFGDRPGEVPKVEAMYLEPQAASG